MNIETDNKNIKDRWKLIELWIALLAGMVTIIPSLLELFSNIELSAIKNAVVIVIAIAASLLIVLFIYKKREKGER